MLNELGTVDRVLHALADPSRRMIVERLSRGSATVSELARPLEMTLSAVLQHLQVLESSGVVRSEKVGRVRICRIEPAALRTVEQWISERRASWERRLDRLGEVLARPEQPRPAPTGSPGSHPPSAAPPQTPPPVQREPDPHTRRRK